MKPCSFELPPFRVEQVFTILSETMNWGMSSEGIPDMWKITRGLGVKIAILDTGASTCHQDLAGAIIQTADFTNSRIGVEDQHGHGTFCAGVAGARQNDFGVVGVAPDCQLLIGKIMGDDGSGNEQSVIKGLEWAAAQGADIISMSIGSPISTPLLCDAIKAVTQATYIICAAGNAGPSLDSISYPARYLETISVGAVDRQKQVTNFSSRGDRVDIVAPGDQIISCWPPNGTAMLSGTSMSTPFVAGVIALIIADRKKDGRTPLTRDQMLDVLLKSAVDLGTLGRDKDSGLGLINPATLLSEAEEHYPT
jgi:subtilisin family serine protease